MQTLETIKTQSYVNHTADPLYENYMKLIIAIAESCFKDYRHYKYHSKALNADKIIAESIDFLYTIGIDDPLSLLEKYCRMKGD